MEIVWRSITAAPEAERVKKYCAKYVVPPVSSSTSTVASSSVPDDDTRTIRVVRSTYRFSTKLIPVAPGTAPNAPYAEDSSPRCNAAMYWRTTTAARRAKAESASSLSTGEAAGSAAPAGASDAPGDGAPASGEGLGDSEGVAEGDGEGDALGVAVGRGEADGDGLSAAAEVPPGAGSGDVTIAGGSDGVAGATGAPP